MRIIRDTFPNQYMALIKLKSQVRKNSFSIFKTPKTNYIFLIKKDADSFYLHNNNRKFNSIEENVCHLVYVERIEALNSSKVIYF